VSVRVVRKDSRQPQEGCEVFLSVKNYSTDPGEAKAVTDQHGTVRLTPAGRGIQLISVRYEDLVLKAPLLAGAGPSSMERLFRLIRQSDVAITLGG